MYIFKQAIVLYTLLYILNVLYTYIKNFIYTNLEIVIDSFFQNKTILEENKYLLSILVGYLSILLIYILIQIIIFCIFKIMKLYNYLLKR